MDALISRANDRQGTGSTTVESPDDCDSISGVPAYQLEDFQKGIRIMATSLTLAPCPDCGAEVQTSIKGRSHERSCPLILAKTRVAELDALWFRNVGLPLGARVRIREIAPCEHAMFRWLGFEAPPNALMAVKVDSQGWPGDEYLTFPPGYPPEDDGNEQAMDEQ